MRVHIIFVICILQKENIKSVKVCKQYPPDVSLCNQIIFDVTYLIINFLCAAILISIQIFPRIENR